MLSAAGFSPDANGRKWAPTATKLITSFSSALLSPFFYFFYLFSVSLFFFSFSLHSPLKVDGLEDVIGFFDQLAVVISIFRQLNIK